MNKGSLKEKIKHCPSFIPLHAWPVTVVGVNACFGKLQKLLDAAVQMCCRKRGYTWFEVYGAFVHDIYKEWKENFLFG